MNRGRAILLSVIASSAATNCWYRGPVFGFLPFLIFTIPPTLIIAAPLFWLRLSRRVAVTIAVAVSILISYFFCAPPTTGRLFTQQLGMDIPEDVSNLQRWNDDWARDPGYYLRFRTTEETVMRIATSARLAEAPARKSAILPPERFLLPVPDWWAPDEIEAPRIWQGSDVSSDLWLNLYFDPQAGVAYLEVLTT